MSGSSPADTFIARWSQAGGSERANYQLFIAGLCTLLDVPCCTLPSPCPTIRGSTAMARTFG